MMRSERNTVNVFSFLFVCCLLLLLLFFFTCKMMNQTPVGDSSSPALHSIDPVVDCMEV